MKKRKMEGLKNHKGGLFLYDESFMRMVVRDYEDGNASIRQVALKYGLKYHNIQDWRERFKSDIAPVTKAAVEMTPEEKEEQESLKKELARLKKENEYLKMKELALETLVDIAKEKYDIDLRKKPGTKPSGE